MVEKCRKIHAFLVNPNDTISVKSVICELKMKQISRFKNELPNEGKLFIHDEIKHIILKM